MIDTEKKGAGTALATAGGNSLVLTEPVELDTSRAFKRSALEDWHGSVDFSNNKALKLAKLVMLFVFGFGGIWAATAPLGGAVIATGRVVAENQNRVIQHYEGGILHEVLVREGQLVEAGQVLARLDDTQIRPRLANLELQRAVLLVQLARRRAEIAGQDEITLPVIPDELKANPRLQETIASQSSEFHALNNLTKSQIGILDNKIKGLQKDINGQRAVIAAREKQEELLALELVDFKDLLENGLIQRTRVYATERELATVRAGLETAKLEIEKSRTDIISTEAQKNQVRLEQLKQAEDISIKLQKDLNQLEVDIGRFQDVLERTLLRSPSPGRVFRIAKKTIGAVLRPGDALMEIVPTLDDFRVEANVAIRDIEQIYVGQEVEMRFMSVKSRADPPLQGKITYVSSDAVVSEKSPEGNYIAYVSINDGEQAESILPGNLATVFIKTEPKTFFQILVQPLTRFSERAFKG